MKQHDSVMVVVDKLTNTTHFIHVKTTNMIENVVEIYIKEVVRIHGVPKETVSDREPNFTSNFRKCLLKGCGKNINLSTTYHLELDGKPYKTNRIMEDILRMHVIS
jgi:hypothetical protein